MIALKSGGGNIPLRNALDCIYGYAVGIDFTRRDLQAEAKKPAVHGKLRKRSNIRHRFRQSCPQAASAIRTRAASGSTTTASAFKTAI
ncbi:hypothetical protein AJ87_30150 [Rhizobium yanglingense]|nr:hypothetical protein AJ87_30150 [Rhizobium yanglingense]